MFNCLANARGDIAGASEPPLTSVITSSIEVIMFSSIKADTSLCVRGPNGDSSMLLQNKIKWWKV